MARAKNNDERIPKNEAAVEELKSKMIVVKAMLVAYDTDFAKS